MLTRINKQQNSNDVEICTSSGTGFTSMKNFMLAKEIIPDFTGNGDYFQQWEAQLKSVQTAYVLDENNTKALISIKLKGRALKWFYSRSDIMSMSVANLLGEMRMLFEDRSSRLALMKEFEGRKWHSNESFQEYFNEKLILSNKILMNEADLLEHIIEGIPDYFYVRKQKYSGSVINKVCSKLFKELS